MMEDEMNYAKIRQMDISNGSGIGISLFVQGCHFHCKGCFNQETWDFSGGKEWTKEIEDKFIKLANEPYIKRISFLGGEPLADENIYTVYSIIQRLRDAYPDKKIWIYTGYTWEDIVRVPDIVGNTEMPTNALIRLMTVYLADVVVDGQFQLTNQDIGNKNTLWAGSTNQRVIDVKETLKEKEIKIWRE